MKTDKIRVNRTNENPEGIEVDIVQPESPLETKVMEYLLTAFIQHARSSKGLPYDLPADLRVEHQTAGSFAAIGAAKTDSPYYQPPRPLAVMALRQVANGFDVIHAEIKTPEAPPAQSAPAEKTETPAAPPAPAPAPDPDAQND